MAILDEELLTAARVGVGVGRGGRRLRGRAASREVCCTIRDVGAGLERLVDLGVQLLAQLRIGLDTS
jgi:hypothetical protein